MTKEQGKKLEKTLFEESMAAVNIVRTAFINSPTHSVCGIGREIDILATHGLVERKMVEKAGWRFVLTERGEKFGRYLVGGPHTFTEEEAKGIVKKLNDALEESNMRKARAAFGRVLDAHGIPDRDDTPAYRLWQAASIGMSEEYLTGLEKEIIAWLVTLPA